MTVARPAPGRRLAGAGVLLRRVSVVALLGLVTGGLASLAAIGFVAGIEWLNDAAWISPRSRMIAGDWPWLAVATVAVPAAGGLAVGLLHRYLFGAGGAEGPPEVILAAQAGHGRLSLRRGLGSALAALTSLGAGASVGQYGPLVHLGGTLGSTLGHWLRMGGARLRTIGIGCGVAAAISTAFNAPIAGILFAHEVVLRHYSLRAFAPITVAATIGFVITNVVFDSPALFRVDEVPRVEPLEYVAFVVVGVGGALVAIAYMGAILAATRAAARSRLPLTLRPAAAGAALGIAALWVPDILGIGKELLRFAIIPEAFTPPELGLLLAAKIAATAVCLGFGFVGGVFSPALVTGALFGALAGYAALPLVAGAADSLGVYAICGMAAVTSPVIGAPITTILIVFELTRNYDLTTAVMVSVVFANLVSYRLFGRSMFDLVLRARGCDLSFGRDQLVLDRTPIAPYVAGDYVAVEPGERRSALRDRLVRTGASEAQVVDAAGRYLGTVTLNDLLAALEAEGDAAVGGLATWDIAVLRADMSVLAALGRAESDESGILPVLESADSDRLVGVIAQSTIVRAYRETLLDIRREEHEAP